MSVFKCVSSIPPTHSPGIRLNRSYQLSASSRQGLEGVCWVDGNIPVALPTRAKVPAGGRGEEGRASSPLGAKGQTSMGKASSAPLASVLAESNSAVGWGTRVLHRWGKNSRAAWHRWGRGTPGGIRGICRPGFLVVGMALGLIGGAGVPGGGGSWEVWEGEPSWGYTGAVTARAGARPRWRGVGVRRGMLAAPSREGAAASAALSPGAFAASWDPLRVHCHHRMS